MKTLTEADKENLRLLTTTLEHIRFIARNRPDEIEHIYDLADATHNIPNIIADENGQLDFLLDDSVKETKRLLKQSTLQTKEHVEIESIWENKTFNLVSIALAFGLLISLIKVTSLDFLQIGLITAAFKTLLFNIGLALDKSPKKDVFSLIRQAMVYYCVTAMIFCCTAYVLM